MSPTKNLPLEGIRVVELGHTVMGPTCGLILADMGADVYKVERTGKGDSTRWLKGFGSGFFYLFQPQQEKHLSGSEVIKRKRGINMSMLRKNIFNRQHMITILAIAIALLFSGPVIAA